MNSHSTKGTMSDHESHDHSLEEEGVYGMGFGIRLVEDEGRMYLAEVEISPYLDEPGELGATLVFHPLDGIDPVEATDEDWDSWIVDIDDDLTRDGSASFREQFAAIIRQLRATSEETLRGYLRAAREEADGG